jgi:hypothetical protein
MPKSRKKAHRHVFTHGSELKDVSILLYFLQMLLLPNVKVPGALWPLLFSGSEFPLRLCHMNSSKLQALKSLPFLMTKDSHGWPCPLNF